MVRRRRGGMGGRRLAGWRGSVCRFGRARMSEGSGCHCFRLAIGVSVVGGFHTPGREMILDTAAGWRVSVLLSNTTR